MLDETIVRLFPPLRSAWAQRGRQAEVPISGSNARRVLYGAINIRTGHRIIEIRRSMRGAEFHDFLRGLRRRYRQRVIGLVLDAASSHTSEASRRLARALGIRLIWLPKQAPELNAMDQLWRHLKQHIAANRQYDTIESLAEAARNWLLSLTPHTALVKAGILSDQFWLKRISQNF